MNLTLFGDEAHKLSDLLAPYAGRFELVEQGADFVLVFGGDGTLMRAEHAHPGVPKVFLRNSQVAKLAPKMTNEAMLERLFGGSFVIVEYGKLEVSVNGERVGTALNDVVIHNENPRHAVRYRVTIDGVVRYEQVIGDGIVCATPLGSTGYYRSITDSSIETGIGLAFNNSTEQTDHIVLRETSVIRVDVTRGPGFCYVDNHETSTPLIEGSIVEIKQSSEVARMVAF